ncbi:MAG TPA: hypothetical protein VF516_27720 [Kofleriaceae bacterium]
MIGVAEIFERVAAERADERLARTLHRVLRRQSHIEHLVEPRSARHERRSASASS